MQSFNSMSGTGIRTLANITLPQRTDNPRNATHSTAARLPGVLRIQQCIINVIHLEAAQLSSDIAAKREVFQLNGNEKQFYTITVLTISIKEHYEAVSYQHKLSLKQRIGRLGDPDQRQLQQLPNRNCELPNGNLVAE